MSTAANHRTRSHRSYYIRRSATTGHARQTWITTQHDKYNRQQRNRPNRAMEFFERVFKARKREAHNAADT